MLKSYDISRLNVLVIERNPLIRRILRETFSAFGVPNLYVTDCTEEGWDLFIDFEPDLVLTDWNHDLDGMRLLSKLRHDPESVDPYCPVIVVTANTEMHHVLTARDRGMTEYLAKPVAPQTLYDRIVAVIENERPFIRCSDFFGPDRRRRKRAIHYRGAERRSAVA
ncbi:MAG: response regulator [Rhodospirillales bacterium]